MIDTHLTSFFSNSYFILFIIQGYIRPCSCKHDLILEPQFQQLGDGNRAICLELLMARGHRKVPGMWPSSEWTVSILVSRIVFFLFAHQMWLLQIHVTTLLASYSLGMEANIVDASLEFADFNPWIHKVLSSHYNFCCLWEHLLSLSTGNVWSVWSDEVCWIIKRESNNARLFIFQICFSDSCFNLIPKI